MNVWKNFLYKYVCGDRLCWIVKCVFFSFQPNIDVQESINFLESEFDRGISDNYTLALVTYALSSGRSPKAKEALDMLTWRAEQEGKACNPCALWNVCMIWESFVHQIWRWLHLTSEWDENATRVKSRWADTVTLLLLSPRCFLESFVPWVFPSFRHVLPCVCYPSSCLMPFLVLWPWVIIKAMVFGKTWAQILVPLPFWASGSLSVRGE